MVTSRVHPIGTGITMGVVMVHGILPGSITAITHGTQDGMAVGMTHGMILGITDTTDIMDITIPGTMDIMDTIILGIMEAGMAQVTFTTDLLVHSVTGRLTTMDSVECVHRQEQDIMQVHSEVVA